MPAFGKPLGLVISNSEGRAVRYDLEGKAIEFLKGAYRVGDASLVIGNGRVSGEVARNVILGSH